MHINIPSQQSQSTSTSNKQPLPPGQQSSLTIPHTKMWRIFYVTLGAGGVIGVGLYTIFYYGLADLLSQPRFGLPVAALLGLVIGFSYYLFFKFVLRAATHPFLSRAKPFIPMPVKPLPPPWVSSEIDELEDLLTGSLDTLDRLDQFSTIAKEITASLDASRTLERIVQTVVETLPADGALLFLFDEQQQTYQIGAMDVSALPGERQERVWRSTRDDQAEWVTAASQQRCILAPTWPGEKIPTGLSEMGVRALLSAPLIVGDQTIGTLSIFNCERDALFNENDLKLVCTYADLAAIAINNAQRYQETETTRNELEAILNDISNLVIVLDQQGRVLQMNPAARQQLRLSERAISEQPLDAVGVADLVNALKAAQAENGSVLREVAGFEGITYQATISPVQSVGWVVVMQDITPLKALDKLRTDWVAAVSHDMKNPLTIIQMAAGLLDKADDLDKRHQRLAHRIQHGTMQLRSLVTNVLDLARLEAGPTLQLSPLDPKEVIEKAMAEVEPLAADKTQTLRCDLPPTLPKVQGDGTLLTRALVNLLSNAVKYTPEAKSITVRAQGQEDIVQIQVIDTGCGIPPEALSHLFERFYRVPNSDVQAEGTGLGLNIVKSIIDKHGGHIAVTSTPGQGSTFTIRLPQALENHQNPIEPSNETSIETFERSIEL